MGTHQPDRRIPVARCRPTFNVKTLTVGFRPLPQTTRTSPKQSRQHPMLSGRFGRDAPAPLGRVNLGGAQPPLVLERGAQLAVFGFEFPEPLGPRSGAGAPRPPSPTGRAAAREPEPSPPLAAARCRSPAGARAPAGAVPRAPTVRSPVSSSIVTSIHQRRRRRCVHGRHEGRSIRRRRRPSARVASSAGEPERPDQRRRAARRG